MGTEPRATRAHDQSGAIAVMTVVLLGAMLVATSLAVDVGRAAYVSRDQQGVTDRAVLDAVPAVLDGPYATLAQVHTAVEQAVDESLGRNPGTSLGTAQNRQIGMIELLRRDDDGDFESVCSADYAPSTSPSCVGDGTYTWTDVVAIRVETTSFVPFLFALGDPGRDVVKTAVAETQQIGQVTVGSEVAGLNGGLLNDLVETILCSTYEATTDTDVDADGVSITGSSGTRVEGLPSCSIDASLVGWQGLAGAHVTLGDLVDGLDLGAGSPEQVLATDVTVADVLTVAAAALGDDGSGAWLVLNELATEINQSLTVQLGDLMNIETGTVGEAADAQIDLFQLVVGSMQLVNGTNFLAVPSLDLTLPGLGSVSTGLSVIEAPRSSAFGRPVVSATTSQVGLDVSTVLDASVASDLESLVSGLVGGLLSGLVTVDVAPIVLPVEVDVASAEATLEAITCGDAVDQSDTTATVTTTTDAVSIGIGNGTDWVEVSDVDIEVLPLLGSPITSSLSIQVRMPRVDVGGSAGETNAFTGPFRAGPEHTAGTVSFPSTGSLEIQVIPSGSLSGLAGIAASVATSLSSTLSTTLPPLINQTLAQVVDPLLGELGLGLGNADTWVDQVDCEARRLLPLGS